MLVYRDRNGASDFVGRIDYSTDKPATFIYDRSYLDRGTSAGELGISELLPLDNSPYYIEEFGPFFRGLLPEGEVYGNLAELYQIPRSDYLAMLERLGCESIGALTFVSESVDLDEYEPRYEPVCDDLIQDMRRDPARMATFAASSTRLSLSGAQSKVAWYLPQEADETNVETREWLIPRGTAPSTHIIKISRKGEEPIALNELACSLLSQSCGIETAKVAELPGVPGAISVKRYDRISAGHDGGLSVVRLHQEDFCQALGFAPFYKYQPAGVSANYPAMAAQLLESASINPKVDKLELVKRLVFCYAVGNSDAHLKNFSLLYDRKWKGRRLAPMYDVTCIPLTGYSTDMPFDFGNHRGIDAVDEKDIMVLAADMGISLSEFDRAVFDIVRAFEAPSLGKLDQQVEGMMERILDNAQPRVTVLKNFLG